MKMARINFRLLCLLGLLLVTGACDGGVADQPASTTLAPAASSTVAATSTTADVAIALPIYDAGSWRELGSLAMDSRSLEAAFAVTGYQLPFGSEVYLVEIVPGFGQPAYLLYEAGQGAFSTEFYPASTVKLLTSVGALEYLGDLGFSGAARVQFDDGFAATVSSLYESAITVSSNESYDRMVQMAGLGYLNDVFLPGYGFDSFEFRYSMTLLDLEHPPGYVLSEMVTVGSPPSAEYRVLEVAGSTTVDSTTETTVPAFEDRNDTDLFDLVDGLRRVMLAGEIPEDERFELSAADLEGLQDSLNVAYPSFLEVGAAQVLGNDVAVWHKGGWMPGAECVDHAYVEDPSSGRRFFLAATIPYEDNCGGLATLAAEVFGVVDHLAAGIPLQADGGVGIGLALWADGSDLLIDLGTSADSGRFFIDDALALEVSADGTLEEVTLSLPEPGHHVLFVMLYSGGERLAYRSVGFTVPAAS